MRLLLYLVTILVLLAGCNDVAEAPSVSSVLPATATLLPTPTLAPGLPTNPPPTPLLTPMVGETAVSPATSLPATEPATPAPLYTSTATPLPAERVEIGQAALAVEDFSAAAAQFAASLGQPETLTADQQTGLFYQLGVAYLKDGRFSEAIATFNQLLAQTGAVEQHPALYFLIGQAYTAVGDAPAAIAAYQTYLAANPDTAAYVQPLIAAIYLAAGDQGNAIAAYEAALTAPAHRLTQVENRLKLAELYLAITNYPAAIAQYDAVHNLAITEATKGQMTYLAGYAEILAGDVAGGYARYQTAVTSYPRAYESYLGLVALVEAGQPVDEYQRGLVDFYAEAHQPAVEAFTRYIAASETLSSTYQADAALYMAWSYEALGDIANALTALERYAQQQPAVATLERAHLLARAGQLTEAATSYESYLVLYPDGADAPEAAWQLAEIAEITGDISTAVSRYAQMAERYNWHEDAPEALFHAGWLAQQQGDTQTAVSLWWRLAQTYPNHEYGAAALVWLMRLLPRLTAVPTTTPTSTPDPDQTPLQLNETPTPPIDAATWLATVQSLAAANQQFNYYAVRARDVLNGITLFPAATPNLVVDPADQEAAEVWLRNWLGLAADTDVRSLAPELANDARLILGSKLWQMGLLEAAKRELEAVRSEAATNALHSYQLALYFRDLGLYRSSIIAASSLIGLTGQTVVELPEFIGRLAYPVYYADLIVPLAAEYSYNPLLQFSLVRQESLFESFARSGAAAQGLSQVIPSTGAYIADVLDWPDYVNEDLYKPYVGLRFGAFYLHQQLAAFDGTVHAALAAYNGGPGNSARWYGVAGNDLDLFVETVTFPETRLYIERIYVGYEIYRLLYAGEG